MSKLDTFKMLEKAGKFVVTAIIAAGTIVVADKGKNVLDKSIEDGVENQYKEIYNNSSKIGKYIMGKPRK